MSDSNGNRGGDNAQGAKILQFPQLLRARQWLEAQNAIEQPWERARRQGEALLEEHRRRVADRERALSMPRVRLDVPWDQAWRDAALDACLIVLRRDFDGLHKRARNARALIGVVRPGVYRPGCPDRWPVCSLDTDANDGRLELCRAKLESYLSSRVRWWRACDKAAHRENLESEARAQGSAVELCHHCTYVRAFWVPDPVRRSVQDYPWPINSKTPRWR